MVTDLIVIPVRNYANKGKCFFLAAIQKCDFFFVGGENCRILEPMGTGINVGFEAQNCLPPQNLIQSTKLHLSTEPAFLPNTS